MIQFRSLFASLAVVSLAACGGPDGPIITDPPGPGMTGFEGATPGTPAEEQLAGDDAAYRALTDAFNAYPDQADYGVPSPADTFSPSSSASYTGTVVARAAASKPVQLDIAGNIALTLDFNNDAVTGSITDLVRRDGTTFAGSLNVGNGSADRTDSVGASFDADVTGRVVDQNDEPAIFDMSLSFGEVLGDNGEYVRADFSGDVDYLGEAGANYFGDMRATRD